ncbi:hypothetical protein BGZ88_005099 [Linnemannia elongata]|nr:hypothetical protein BGZ88_005099 [Linnemannia elongata]
MMHPWFRMVNPERNTLGEPAEDPEGCRPLLAEELDAEIILHMRWLFAPGPSHSDPEAKEVFDEEALLREIEEKMTNNEENMEKLFYHLLCQHKTELLENYAGEDNESVLDGPRRRADSFPNSSLASRSHTPDLSRASRSPRDSPLTSPVSPLTPMSKISSAEPAPFTLNPLEAAVARAASAAKIAARTPTPPCSLVNNALLVDASVTKEKYPSSARGADEPKKDKAVAPVTTPQPVQETPAPQPEQITTSNSGSSKVTTTEKPKEQQAQVEHPVVIAPKPVSPIAQRSLIVNPGFEPKAAPTAQSEEAPKPPSKKSDAVVIEVPSETAVERRPTASGSSVTSSIESQVLSTQISEAIRDSSMMTPPLPPPTSQLQPPQPPTSRRASPVDSSARILNQTTNTSSTEVSAKAQSSKPQRPILHPLDVKAFAGTTTMSVSVSQHSRKYSEGSPSAGSTTPLSPTGPKRPWFARLFDFKPQPLTFRSNWSAAETQERLEAIMKDIFQSSIQVESYKRPSFGVKCRYEGGLIDDHLVKAVKFKIEITEKTGYLASSSSTASNTSTFSSVSNASHTSTSTSHIMSSSAVAAILATVDHHHHGHYHGSPSVTSTASGPTSAGATSSTIASSVAVPEVIVAARRASDGGSILSSAAAAVSTSLAAARNPFSSNSHHHQYHHHLHHTGGAYPPLPHPSALPRRMVKVTLHQQQGANSTLRAIYEKLVVVWEQQTLMYEQQQAAAAAATSCSTISTTSGVSGGGGDFRAMVAPAPIMQKAPRGPAM